MLERVPTAMQLAGAGLVVAAGLLTVGGRPSPEVDEVTAAPDGDG
jgi:hypothetical protein